MHLCPAVRSSLAGRCNQREGDLASYRPVMRDYKPAVAKPKSRGRWLLWFIAGLGIPLVTVALIIPTQEIHSVPEPVVMQAVATKTSPAKPVYNPTDKVSRYVAAPEPLPAGER